MDMARDWLENVYILEPFHRWMYGLFTYEMVLCHLFKKSTASFIKMKHLRRCVESP